MDFAVRQFLRQPQVAQRLGGGGASAGVGGPPEAELPALALVDDGGVAEAIRAAPGAHGLARCRRVGEQQGVGDVLAAVGDPLREKVPAE